MLPPHIAFKAVTDNRAYLINGSLLKKKIKIATSKFV